jgi:hypothetical protein
MKKFRVVEVWIINQEAKKLFDEISGTFEVE